MMHRYTFALAAAGLMVAGVVHAQVPDPTRPAGFMAVPDASAGASAPGAEGVQTVIIRQDGKSSAVINGQYVAVGQKLGDKRVVRINESEVVLQGENGREIIKLTPAIEKVPARKAAANKQRTTGTGQQ